MTLQTMPKASVIDALRRNGFKATPQRIAICNFALNSREHPTTQEVYREVKKVYPTLSLTTVYKTLQVLKQLHLIQELAFSGGERFDSYMEPHLNIICVRCGEILDIDDHSAREMVIEPLRRQNTPSLDSVSTSTVSAGSAKREESEYLSQTKIANIEKLERF